MKLRPDEFAPKAVQPTGARRVDRGMDMQWKPLPDVARKRHSWWKETINGAPFAAPSFILPFDRNPNNLACYGKAVGARFKWTRMSDGWWVWKLPA